MIKLSIIIVNWNTKELLKKCVHSIIKVLDRSLAQKTEIIIVDNGSSDGSQKSVKNFQFFSPRLIRLGRTISNLQIRLIENKSNFGFAKANNQGLKIAQGEYVMLLNSDTEVKQYALEKLIDYLKKHKEVAAVSPMLLLPDGSLQSDYYMKFPNLWQIFLYHNPLIRPLVMRTPLRWLLVSKVGKDSFEVDQLPGAALMAHKEVWKKIGPLDEDYQFLFEDVDWCWRAKKLNYRLAVVTEARITHIGGGSWKKRLRENSFDFYRQYFTSMLLFVRKNYGSIQELIFRFALVKNLIITLKPLLAWHFLSRRQEQKWG